MLGLTPDEMQKIDSALAKADSQIAQLRLASAKTSRSARDDKLTIELPPLGAEGTSCYQAVLDVVKSTMGPERFALFNQIAGDNFDQSFNHFGADDITYEITLAPVTRIAGQPAYTYVRSFRSVDHNSTGNSSGIASAATAGEDMVLKHFLESLPSKRPDA